MKTLLSLILTLFSFFAVAQDTLRHTVYFDSDSHEISSEELQKLTRFSARINPSYIKEFHLDGHTDGDASERYNDDLALRRVTSVMKQIPEALKQEITHTHKGHGELDPVADNITEEGKQANRRVEIWAITNPAPDSESYYYDGWKQQTQTFLIDPRKENTIRGKDGVVIYFPKDAFCIEGNEKVKIDLKEYIELSDIVLAQLTTSSDDKMLETRGMVDIDATYRGEPTELCKPIALLFPALTPEDKDFQLFNGEHSKDDEHINWTAADGGNGRVIDQFWVDQTNQGSPILNFGDCVDGLTGNVKIRCYKKCANQVLGEGGYRSYRSQLRADEVILALRHRHWFKSSVPVERYQSMYTQIKTRMNDTLSASAFSRCYRLREQALANQAYLDSLTNGGTIDEDKLDASVNYIAMKSAELGTINCDRFTNETDKGDFRYDYGLADGRVSSRLIFHDIRSIMPGRNLGESSEFRNIPRGQLVTLLVIKYLHGKVYVGKSNFKIGYKPELRFEEVKKEDLSDRIRSIVNAI